MPEWGPGRRVSEARGLRQLWLPREATGNLRDAVSSLVLKQSQELLRKMPIRIL